MKKYKIEFTEQQLITVATGLEFYSRFCAGQWRIPDAMELKEFDNNNRNKEFWNLRNEVDELLINAKKTFMPHLSLHESYDIGSEELCEDAKIAYDIYRPIWEIIYKDAESWNVYSSPGLTYSSEGRITVKEVQ